MIMQLWREPADLSDIEHKSREVQEDLCSQNGPDKQLWWYLQQA